jgi:hypothetical protein
VSAPDRPPATTGTTTDDTRATGADAISRWRPTATDASANRRSVCHWLSALEQRRRADLGVLSVRVS